VWEAQGAYQERAKKTEQKGDTERALARRCFDLAEESLTALGKWWMYIYYIILYCIHPGLGIGDYSFCGAGKGAYCSRLGGASGGARGGALREYGGAEGSTCRAVQRRVTDMYIGA